MAVRNNEVVNVFIQEQEVSQLSHVVGKWTLQ
jgi:hypothetical protein